MRAMIATWPRRLLLATTLFILAFLMAAVWLRYTHDTAAPGAADISNSTLMNSLLTLPAAMAALAFSLTSFIARPAQAEPIKESGAPVSAPMVAAAFKAQVVGVEWLNPLMRRDYPTEWQLLWTLGLAKPNAKDDMVKEDPKSFSSVQFVSQVVSNIDARNPFYSIFRRYVEAIVQPIGRRYALKSYYFYTVQPDSKKRWSELHGIHMQVAIPATDKLPPKQAADLVRYAMNQEFEFSSDTLSTANIPADVHITSGGANAGFTSLNAAMDYLQANPDKSAWVMNWDSPDYPSDSSLAENCTLLILAGPQMNTQREPLAWIGRPAVTHTKDFETKEGASKTYQAWEAALKQAAKQADTKVGEVAYVIHDTGVGANVGKRTAGLAQALTVAHPELNFLEDGFNTPKLLGDMRAGSAVTNLALAIAWTHQKGKPVLVAGTTEIEDPVAVVVTPPAKPRIFHPDKDWFRARGEGNAYLPWWGLRKDFDWSTYMQGFSD